jgi:hypothetical protein
LLQVKIQRRCHFFIEYQPGPERIAKSATQEWHAWLGTRRVGAPHEPPR